MRIGLEETLLGPGRDLFSALGEVVPLSDPTIDACVVRATVSVGAEFLESHPALKYVATATSGSDHLDLEALMSKGVRSYIARGCNAEAVADWVVLALRQMGVQPRQLGLVGLGHTGQAVERRFNCGIVTCDPPRASREQSFASTAIDNVFSACDVVSLHVPLLPSTRGFIDASLLDLLGDGVLLNASRGEVLNVEDALRFRRAGGRLGLDVFPGEPSPDRRLIQAACVATPHIAGHTFEAKNRGLEMCAAWLADVCGDVVKGRGGYVGSATPPAQVLRAATKELRAGADFRELRRRSVRAALPAGSSQGF